MEKEYAKVLVAADVIVEKDRRYLLVQEKKKSAYGLWNFPAGKVEVGETIAEAAVREVKEETGYSVKLIGEVMIIHEDLEHCVEHIFAGEITDGDLKFPEDEIMDAQWFSLEEIESMKNALRFAWILEAVMKYEETFKNFV
ncbi:MAG: NUDIX domain-containing protein [Patescibacteria group bacterium]|nr:NUDIX domain-containing protein [Patescibacteria group bacterium]